MYRTTDFCPDEKGRLTGLAPRRLRHAQWDCMRRNDQLAVKIVHCRLADSSPGVLSPSQILFVPPLALFPYLSRKQESHGTFVRTDHWKPRCIKTEAGSTVTIVILIIGSRDVSRQRLDRL